MAAALNATGHPIEFSACIWGTSNPWNWMGPVANSWRIDDDIANSWDR
jgi:alpha-galactosidase